MIKVRPTITLDLETSGQKITVDIQEARDIIKSLSKFVNTRSYNNITKRGRKARIAKTKVKRGRRRNKNASLPQNGRAVPMRETKRQEIIDHISSQLSARPKTLSALLKGISYVPNHLPAIRQMVESRGNITREVIGKRTYYSRKASTASSQKQTRANAA